MYSASLRVRREAPAGENSPCRDLRKQRLRSRVKSVFAILVMVFCNFAANAADEVRCIKPSEGVGVFLMSGCHGSQICIR